MWKWKTVCQAAAPQELIRLTPSAPRRSVARRGEPLGGQRPSAARSSGSISSRSVAWRRGDHQRVAARGRVDVHERDRALVLGDASGRAARRRRSCRRCSRDRSHRAASLPAPGRALSRVAGVSSRACAIASSRRGHLARVKPAASSSAAARPSRGPGRDARAPRPARRRAPAAAAGRPRQRQRLGQQLAGQLEMARDRALGVVAAGRQPVGDAQQGHVDRHRRAGVQVVVDRRGGPAACSCTRKPRRRWWRVSAATWLAQPLGRPAAGPGSSRGHLGPGLVVAHERRPGPRRSPPRVCGLAMSCSSAPKRSACPRVSSLASGSASSRGQRRARRLVGAPATGRAPASIASASTARVWPCDVEVVIAALLARPRSAPARAAPPRWPRAASISSRPAERAAARRRRRRSSANTRSGATAASPAALRPRRAPACPGSASKPSSQASRASRSTRSGSSAKAPAETIRSRRGAQVGGAAERVDAARSSPAAAAAIALMVRSRRAEVLLDASAPPRPSTSTCQLRSRATHPPGAERLRELERDAAGARGRPPGRRGRPVARDDDVEVGVARPSSRSRTAPPTSQAPLGAERRASGGERVGSSRHPVTSRRGDSSAVTRSEIPHSTSWLIVPIRPAPAPRR